MPMSDSSSDSSSDHGIDHDNFNADDICNNCQKYNCRCVHITENPYAIELPLSDFYINGRWQRDPKRYKLVNGIYQWVPEDRNPFYKTFNPAYLNPAYQAPDGQNLNYAKYLTNQKYAGQHNTTWQQPNVSRSGVIRPYTNSTPPPSRTIQVPVPTDKPQPNAYSYRSVYGRRQDVPEHNNSSSGVNPYGNNPIPFSKDPPVNLQAPKPKYTAAVDMIGSGNRTIEANRQPAGTQPLPASRAFQHPSTDQRTFQPPSTGNHDFKPVSTQYPWGYAKRPVTPTNRGSPRMWFLKPSGPGPGQDPFTWPNADSVQAAQLRHVNKPIPENNWNYIPDSDRVSRANTPMSSSSNRTSPAFFSRPGTPYYSAQSSPVPTG